MMDGKLTGNARIVLEARYLQRRTSGLESPDALFRRVARNIALADVKYTQAKKVAALTRRKPFFRIARDPAFLRLARDDLGIKQVTREFYNMMANLDFLPNSPTLFNAGRRLQQLAGCFVLPLKDDLDEIFQTLRHAAIIHKSGGGTGFSFSHLRPQGDVVRSTQGQASGPVSFMKVFDQATEEIRQGGKRRGANMGVLKVNHPDIEKFIMAKRAEGALRNFNISVGVTSSFMRAIKYGKNYPLINPRIGKRVAMRSARRIFRLLCRQAWKTGDPGLLFLDTINRRQPTPQLGRIETTNPCGEVPLLSYEACNLGSINLSNFVADECINYSRLKEVVWKAIHFLDNTIDMSDYILPQIASMVWGNRKVGLGVMGFADMLVQLGVSYASDDARHIAEKIMCFINAEAKKASAALARTRGVFPHFRKSIYNTGKKSDRVRNATRTSIAPAGSISIIAGCNSGIEPFFALAFEHGLLDGRGITEVNKHVIKAAHKKGFYSERFMRHLMSKGTLKGFSGIPTETKKLFVCARDVPAEQHIKIQAAFQRHTDNAVSKTVNLPAAATIKDIEQAYLLAYALGCKGISVYRQGSKPGQILSMGKRKNTK